MKLKLPTSTGALFALATAAVLAASPAAALRPGQYSVLGIQSICLQSAGTWYYTTFSSGGGGWANITQPNTVKTVIYGEYNTTGNDNIEVRRGVADWNEWQSDLSFHNFIQGAVTWEKKKCDPPATAVRPHQNKNPLQ